MKTLRMVAACAAVAVPLMSMAPALARDAAPLPFAAAGLHRVAAGAADVDGGFSEGEVRKVDSAAGKITLRHGEIRSLDMPPMTMVFQLGDPAQAQGLAPGDKVRFRAIAEGSRLVVTFIERVR